MPVFWDFIQYCGSTLSGSHCIRRLPRRLEGRKENNNRIRRVGCFEFGDLLLLLLLDLFQTVHMGVMIMFLRCCDKPCCILKRGEIWPRPFFSAKF